MVPNPSVNRSPRSQAYVGCRASPLLYPVRPRCPCKRTGCSFDGPQPELFALFYQNPSSSDGQGKSFVILQKPVATQQNVLPLCKKARKSHWSHTCDRALREHFPGHAGLAFQFIPSDLWKTMAEPVFKFKVNRRNLNAKNVAVAVALVLVPPKYHALAEAALVELCFYQRGALLPKEVNACLTSWQKETIGLYLSDTVPLPGSLEEDILRLHGLDPIRAYISEAIERLARLSEGKYDAPYCLPFNLAESSWLCWNHRPREKAS